MSQLVYLIPLFPLVSWAIIGLFNRNLSETVTTILACGSVLASFILSALIFNEKLHDTTAVTCTVFDWMTVGNFSAKMSFLVDSLSSLFLMVITGVGFLIHVYSAGYMHDDEGFRRFFSYLNLFVFFMLLLVLGDNFLVMFIGWEGVGLCSYLLIGFWFKNIDYSAAAKKAFIMNRIGDLGLLLGVLLIYTTTQSVSFQTVLGTEGLAKFDAIVVGIRAYNTKEKLKFYNEKLLEYVNNGGTLVVQYNTNGRDLVSQSFGPYPFKVGRGRTTEEDAEVRFLKPEHPVLNVPNKITSKDFEGWVQERGLYFMSEWAPQYEAILSSNDLAEKKEDGGLLVAKYGKGYYIYTGYSFFRELPAGVPGAYRLFANLLSIGKQIP